jgi:hyperpolarization activated cyclic nucleotide-gated potassium channel 2
VNGKLLSYCDVLLKVHNQEFLIEVVMPNMLERVYNPEEVIFDELDFQ